MKTKFGKRAVWKISDYSLVTPLPPVWRKTNDIDENSKVEMEMNEKGHLIVKPAKEGDESE